MSQEIASILGFLEQVKSPYLQPFLSLSNRIDHEALVAAENLKFLTVLEDPCKQLGAARVCEIPILLPMLLQQIRMIWQISPFYNTSEKITGLLCKVCKIPSQLSYPKCHIFIGLKVGFCRLAMR